MIGDRGAAEDVVAHLGVVNAGDALRHRRLHALLHRLLHFRVAQQSQPHSDVLVMLVDALGDVPQRITVALPQLLEGARLVQRLDGIGARGRALAQAGDLREHEPHPVTALAAGAQLGYRAVIGAARLLGVQEAL